METQNTPPKKWYKKARYWLLALAIVVIGIFTVGAVAIRNNPMLNTLTLPKETHEAKFRIGGFNVSKNEAVKIYQNDNLASETKADGKGNFQADLNLAEGKNTIFAETIFKGETKRSVASVITFTPEKTAEMLQVEQAVENVTKSLSEAEAQKKAEEEKQVEEEIERKDEIEKTKTQLISETEAIRKFSGVDYRDSVDKITIELAIFSVWASLADNAKNSNDAEIKKLGKNLETSLAILQNKEFPQMRLAWGKLLKTKMWEFNVDISVLGNKNNILEIVGAYFASNKNIKDTQLTISDMLKSLRFDRVNYRWYEYDDGYYFTTESKNDNELEILK